MREDSGSAVVLPSVSARNVLGEILREGAQRTLAEAVQAEVPSGSTRGGMSSMNAVVSKSSASATEAAGRLSGVGRTVIDLLLRRGLPVRALVRQRDERADALRDAGAEVVVADLTRPDWNRCYTAQ